MSRSVIVQEKDQCGISAPREQTWEQRAPWREQGLCADLIF